MERWALEFMNGDYLEIETAPGVDVAMDQYRARCLETGETLRVNGWTVSSAERLDD